MLFVPERQIEPAAIARFQPSPATRLDRQRMLLEKARLRLAQSPYCALRRIQCRVESGSLVLHGQVSSYFLKQMAQSLFSDVEQVINQVEVV